MAFRLSVVTPAFNEAANIPVYFERIKVVAATLAREGVEIELVLVDDHSTDATPEAARRVVEANELPTRYLRLSRNSGSHTAIAAGFRACTGDAAVLLAVDLQDPPELICEMLTKLREGNDVVWAVRKHREGEPQSKLVASRIYYMLMRTFATPEMPAQGADYLLIGRKVIDACNQAEEKNTSLLAMILWLGFRQTSIEYVKQARHSGKSKWTLSKKIKLAVDSIVSFSYAPIRLMSLFGLTMAVLGFMYAAFVVVGWVFGIVQHGIGFAALMTTLLVGQGTIMMMLGVLGEYLWRTYDETRSRPRYLIEDQMLSAACGGTLQHPSAVLPMRSLPPAS